MEATNLYIFLETGVLLVFLVMVILTQLARGADPAHFTRHSHQQFRLLLLGFVLLTICFGKFLFTVSPLLAVELAAGVMLSLLNPVNALCFFVHLLFLRPWELVLDNPLLLALPRLLAAICLFSWLIHPKKIHKLTLAQSRGLILISCFSAWLFITTFKAPVFSEAQSDWFNMYFRSLVVFIMCLFFIEDETSVMEFTRTLVISILALAAIGLYGYLLAPSGSDPTRRLQGISDTMLDPNDTAALIVLALPMALGLQFNRRAHLLKWFGKFFVVTISLAAVWFSESRGALLAIFVQVASTRIVRDFRKRWLGLVVLAGIMGVAYMGVLKFVHRDVQEMGASAESRVIYWKAAMNMLAHNPLLGVGFNQYPANYDSYSSGARYEFGNRTAHSSWFLAFAENGLVGGFLFIAFFITVLKTAWKNRQRHPDQFYSLVGYGVAMSFLSHTYAMFIYLISALILASDSTRQSTSDDV